MLSLTRKTDYALVALAHLGHRRQRGQPAGSAREIASQFGMPLPLLMNILKELAKAHLVTSLRGSQGGYALAVEPEHITVMEVVAAMEGPMRLARCTEAPDGLPVVGQGCGIYNACPIHGPVHRLHERINQFLEQTTLADLLETRAEVPVALTTA